MDQFKLINFLRSVQMTEDDFSGMDMEDFSEEIDLQEESMISLKRQLIASEEIIRNLRISNASQEQTIQNLVSAIEKLRSLHLEERRVLENIRLPNLLSSFRISDTSSSKIVEPSIDYSQHPLLNHIIVSNVMQRLPLNDVVRCRLVCRSWWNKANEELRKRKLIGINYRNIENLSKFAKLMETSSDIPFAKFRFGLFVVNTHRPAVEDFFSICGPVITHIALCFANQFCEISLDELRDLFLLCVPNLEKLDVERLPLKLTKERSLFPPGTRIPQMRKLKHLKIWDNMASDNRMDSTYSVGLVHDLISMAPNLTKLSVYTECQHLVAAALKSLEEKRIELRELRLESISEENLLYLTRLRFPLRMLRIEYFDTLTAPESVKSLLTTLSFTLEELHFSDYRVMNHSENLVVAFPRMARLRTLKFRRPWNDRRLLFYPLNFKEQLPFLRKLSFQHEQGSPPYCIHSYNDFVNPEATGPSETVEELEITHELDSVLMFRKLPDSFPNLKILKSTDSSNEIIRAIWEFLPNLQELYLTLSISNRNIDSVITGIPVEVYRQICKENLYSRVDGNVLDIIRTDPSICNLKKLRKLVIEGHQINRVTDFSCSFALIFLKTLTSLTITDADISEDCRDLMRIHLNLVHLEVLP